MPYADPEKRWAAARQRRHSAKKRLARYGYIGEAA